MDGAELYCFEDFESELSPGDDLDDTQDQDNHFEWMDPSSTPGEDKFRIRTRTDLPDQRSGVTEIKASRVEHHIKNADKRDNNWGHGNNHHQQQDGRLDHPAFLGKSQGYGETRQGSVIASKQRVLQRGRTIDIPESSHAGGLGSNRFRAGHLLRTQSTDESKEIHPGPRDSLSLSDRRISQHINQRTTKVTCVKTNFVTEMETGNSACTNDGSVQRGGEAPLESAAISKNVDKFSVRARPDSNLRNKKMREMPPVVALRPGRSGSPRSWNFATQSIVPRFANREDSEILTAIRKSPTFKGPSDERRRPLVTNCSIDSALEQQTNDEPFNTNSVAVSADCVSSEKPEAISIFGPEDLIKDVIAKTGSINREIPSALMNSSEGPKEKFEGQLWSISRHHVAPGLPPSGRGMKVGPTKPLRSKEACVAEELCNCRGSNESENTHKPVCRSLTAPSMSVPPVEDEASKPLPRPKPPLGPRVSAPLLGISSAGAAWRLEDDEARNPPPSPSIDDTPFARATSQPYYAVSPKFNDDEKSGKSNGGSGLVKLARRLSQKGDRRENKGDKPPCRQRSISVDSNSEDDPISLDHWLWPILMPEGDGDTIIKAVGDVRKAHSMENLLQQTSDNSKASSIPPSPTAPQKLHRSWSAKKRSSSNTEVDTGAGIGKDRTKRYSKQMTDSQALFDAVEHQDLDTARLILETNGLDVNQVNEDEFTVLDIAVMTNNMPMARLLLSCGARENPRFLMKDARASKLNTLINEAEMRVQEMTSRLVNIGLNSATGPTGSSKDLEKHLRDWEWRFRLLKRMKAGFEHARVPDHPACVTLSTASSTSLQVRFEEPLNANGAAVTRYKIEWSCSEDFFPPAGEHILYDVRYPSYRIHGLKQGVKYYVRVSAFNMKGFGPSQAPTPPFAIPSCWRDMHGNKSRFSGRLNMIDDLFQQVRDTRPTDSGEIKRSSPRASPNQVRRTVKKSLKNFFQSAPKFQKHLKRGVYLASVMYSDDKVLVTNEDQLPIVEVDETFSSSIHQDFLWFLKVAGTWEDVDLLRSDLERTSGSSPAILFRARLLQAASLLQSALGTQDLGQVFYEPIRDSHGIIIITIVNQIRDQRVMQTMSSLKWTNINRIQKRKSVNMDNPSAAEMLLASLPEKILYHQVSGIKLTKGLYLGYLKLRSSVDTIRVQVPEKLPSVLPHVKLRDNPNVSQEEWEWLHTLDNCQSKRNPTKIQEDFQHLLATGTRKLLVKMGVSEEESLTYRLCDLEVIEMNEQVSVVLLFPPSGSVCLGPGTSDEWIVSKDYISIPVPVFEMVHMTTYQSEFIRRFTRLSSILDIDSLIAQQTLREAFSTDEVNDAKQRLQQVLDYQQELETTWKGMRWIMDVLQYARDKQLRGGVPLSVLYAPPPSPVDSPMDVISDMEKIFDAEKDKSTLQIPNNGQTQPMQFLNPSKETKPSTGILRVFPDYNSGLAKGTSIKLHVTSKTTCREIVNLVIQQLNKAVESHGLDSPLYLEDQWSEFCLVAIISNKEYQLRDDHCPLQLQNPWTKGHLYVRTKDNTGNLLSMGPSTAV
ncbi:uncharacterized protein LOC110978538 isoform X4 [Acanthaster planci]|uniref:Uncharacterized protein LOC110978538 isoform X4 n=1 Tax=Acanthaster planci TaxID=133434 RepID=A0A8B7YAA1_ACAPL|nr:uncharacterized protein LOC110978538 isoform X4 [Acanthaster planci]